MPVLLISEKHVVIKIDEREKHEICYLPWINKTGFLVSPTSHTSDYIAQKLITHFSNHIRKYFLNTISLLRASPFFGLLAQKMHRKCCCCCCWYRLLPPASAAINWFQNWKKAQKQLIMIFFCTSSHSIAAVHAPCCLNQEQRVSSGA